MNRRLAAVLVVIILIIASVVVLIQTLGFRPNHDAIRIRSNSDFLPENGVVGGNGTPQDPFIIAGWRIQVEPLHGSWEWDSAIYIRDTTANFEVRDVRIQSGVEGAGILLVNVHNGAIKDSEVKVIGVAVHLIECSHLIVSKSSLNADQWPAFGSYQSANISVVDSDIVSSFQGSGDLYSMHWLDNAQISLRNCTVRGEVHLSDCSGGFVTANQFEGERGGLTLEGTSNTTIATNVFEHRGISFEGGAIEQEGEYYSDAITNSITSDNRIGDHSIECHIGESGVTVDRADVGQAILMDCSDVVVRNSTFHNSDSGILMIHVGKATIENCTASGCRVGVQLIFCYEIDVHGCHVTGNSGAGIAVVACLVGEIFENNIQDNGEQTQQYLGVEYAGWGLLLYNSADILVYHNVLEDNQKQAGDITPGEKNQWDCGYPSGGNYWDDYEGIDEFSGPGQNVTGSDGIGDTSYFVGHDSNGYSATAIDRYPLLS